jgi:hypothetical protein
VIYAMITCPNTGEAVPAGMRFSDLRSFDASAIEGNTVGCSACGQAHLVDKTTIKVFPSASID